MLKKRNLLKRGAVPEALLGRLRLIGKYADTAGIRVYVVGGFVRDLLLRRIVWDLDIVGETDPAPVAQMFGGRIQRHDRFRTLTIHLDDGSHIDFAMARRETYAGPAALPEVEPGTLKDDFARRDFTVNAMAVSLNRKGFGRLVDPLGGAVDLKKKILRIQHPKSFEDDPTRLFRAVRFMGRYGFRLDRETDRQRIGALKKRLLVKLSRQRSVHEFVRIIIEDDPRPILAIASGWGLLAYVHPRLASCTWRPCAKKDRTELFSWAWYLQDMDAADVEKVLLDCSRPRRLVDAVVSRIEAVRLLRGKVAVDDQMLQDFLNEDIYDIDFLSTADRVDRALLGNFKRYRKAQSAFLNGADLHGLGFVPGREYGEILRQVRRRIWDGKLKNRREAVQFVSENFKG